MKVGAFHPIHCMIHLFFWRSSFWFWTIANCLSNSATSNYLDFFFFSSLEGFLVVNNQPKWTRRVDCIWMWKKLRRLPLVLNDIAVEKMIIVTIEQKSCKPILICGSACICSSVFELFCICHYSVPGVLQVIALLYCFFWVWRRFDVQILRSMFFMHNLFQCRQ